MGLPPAHQKSCKEEPPGSHSWDKEDLSLERRWFNLVLKDYYVQLASPSLTCYAASAASLQPCVLSNLVSASTARTFPGTQPPSPGWLLRAQARALRIHGTSTGMKRFLQSPGGSGVCVVAHRQRHLLFLGEQGGALHLRATASRCL